MWYGLLELFTASHVNDLYAAGLTVGAALLLWRVLTLYPYLHAPLAPR
jgi:hypothetical protein